MINAIDTIDRLPYELAAALECDPFFSDIPVVVMEKGNIAQEIQRKQAVVTEKSGKRGVAVIVLQVVAEDNFPDVAFGPMTLRPAFQVIEQVEMNRQANGTGKSARKIARRIRDVIKPLRLVGLTTDFIAEKNCIIPITTNDDIGANLVLYQVNFSVDENDSEEISMVSMPQFVDAGGATPQVALTCATEGAQVWFTTDDTFPAPTASVPDSTAQLYSGPIDIPVQGFWIRAAGFMPGMIGSQVNRAQVNYDSTINKEQ